MSGFSRKISFALLTLLTGAWFALPAWAQSREGTLSTTLKDFSQLDQSQKNMVMSSLGIPAAGSFTMAKIVAWLLFGAIGFVAFYYGKKQELLKPALIGISLMFYPCFVTGTLLLYGVGAGLCLLLYFWRD